MSLLMTWADWFDLFWHFATLSLLAVGGAITTAPDMHRYLVIDQQWLTETQFANSITIAQASPGPNVLFVALMGWNVGLNSGGPGWGLVGLACTMLGILLPSTTLTYLATKWSHDNRDKLEVKAFKQGLAPIVIALLIATGWILSSTGGTWQLQWPKWVITAVAAILVWRTRIHLLWLLGAGAAVGAMGWV